MISPDLTFSLYDLVSCLSYVTDLISPAVGQHQIRVAYIASCLAREMGLPLKEQRSIILAGELHDIGVLSRYEKIDTLQFDAIAPHRHAEAGYLLLRDYYGFADVAHVVRYHHYPWNFGDQGPLPGDRPIQYESHLLHLADRLDVLLDYSTEHDVNLVECAGRLRGEAGVKFCPEAVKALGILLKRESFWFELSSPFLDTTVRKLYGDVEEKLGGRDLAQIARLFGKIIDFRSRFTAVHSSGVSATASLLARHAGMNDEEIFVIGIAGMFHDFGKLAIPSELLEKPGKLSEKEYSLVKYHSFLTHKLLEQIFRCEELTYWASFHHERIDGAGYPFKVEGKDLSLGARILAVADVFTAITEDRPYRPGMERTRALAVLQEMVATGALDVHLVNTVSIHYEEFCQSRELSQAQASEGYLAFTRHLAQSSERHFAPM